jgi:hypothetical protein
MRTGIKIPPTFPDPKKWHVRYHFLILPDCDVTAAKFLAWRRAPRKEERKLAEERRALGTALFSRPEADEVGFSAPSHGTKIEELMGTSLDLPDPWNLDDFPNAGDGWGFEFP